MHLLPRSIFLVESHTQLSHWQLLILLLDGDCHLLLWGGCIGFNEVTLECSDLGSLLLLNYLVLDLDVSGDLASDSTIHLCSTLSSLLHSDGLVLNNIERTLEEGLLLEVLNVLLSDSLGLLQYLEFLLVLLFSPISLLIEIFNIEVASIILLSSFISVVLLFAVVFLILTLSIFVLLLPILIYFWSIREGLIDKFEGFLNEIWPCLLFNLWCQDIKDSKLSQTPPSKEALYLPANKFCLTSAPDLLMLMSTIARMRRSNCNYLAYQRGSSSAVDPRCQTPIDLSGRETRISNFAFVINKIE